MVKNAFNKLNQAFELFVDTPTRQGQEGLVVAAEDYREEWIVNRSTVEPVQTRKSTNNQAPTRYSKILSVAGKQPDGTELTLALQSRTKTSEDASYSYHVVSWRTRLKPGGSNRRFYFTKEKAWTLDATLALDMLQDLEKNGGLNDKYFDLKRRPNFSTIVSNELPDDKRLSLYNEITLADEQWGATPFFIVLEQREDGWRKILIVNRETGEATFRSTTRREEYMPRKTIRDDSEWYLDNSMQDTNVQQAKVFIEHLRTIISNIS